MRCTRLDKENCMAITVLNFFIMFLEFSDEALKRAIDYYNAGLMCEPARLALEAIEACVDQDSVKIERYQ